MKYSEKYIINDRQGNLIGEYENCIFSEYTELGIDLYIAFSGLTNDDKEIIYHALSRIYNNHKKSMEI